MPKRNLLIILFLSFLILISGVVYFGIQNKWFNKEAKILENRDNSIIIDNGTVKMKNLIKIDAGEFVPSKIDIMIGELVNIENNDEAPTKIIGDDWQMTLPSKGSIFTKGDFKEGENKIYIEGKPETVCIVNVK